MDMCYGLIYVVDFVNLVSDLLRREVLVKDVEEVLLLIWWVENVDCVKCYFSAMLLYRVLLNHGVC